MKLFLILAAICTLASAGHLYSQQAEVYQSEEYQNAQDHQQSNGFGQGFDGGFQVSGHQTLQTLQHQPVQHQSIQTHHVIAQPQHIQFQSEPQHHQYQSQQQHVQFQSQPHVQIQSSHIGGVLGEQSSHLSSGEIGQHGGQIGQDSGESGLNKNAKILNYQHDSDEHNYQYAYETENGIKAQEVGTTGEGTRTQGAYSYTGDDGQVYTVTYTADENGFHPSGAHLPTPPPMPEAIARSVEQNLRDETNGIVDDGQYHQEQEQYSQQSQQSLQKQQPPSHGLFQQLQRHNYEQSHQQQPTTVVRQVQQQPTTVVRQIQQQPTTVVRQVQQQPTAVVHQVQRQPATIVQQVQQQPITVVHQQKQEPIYHQQVQQQQLPTRVPFQRFKQQNLIQQEPQQVIVQQPQHQQQLYQQLKSQNHLQRFQRHQKPVRPQRQGAVKLQEHIEPHVEEHRHVEYIIPTFTRNLHQSTDDYVGPAPAPVTENQY